MFLPDDRKRPSVVPLGIESAHCRNQRTWPAQSLAPQTSEADWKENRPTNKQRVARKTKRPRTKAWLKEDLGRWGWLMERLAGDQRSRGQCSRPRHRLWCEEIISPYCKSWSVQPMIYEAIQVGALTSERTRTFIAQIKMGVSFVKRVI